MKRLLLLVLALCVPGCSLFHPYPRVVATSRYDVRLIDEAGEPLRSVTRNGRVIYLGVVGHTYALRITNSTGRRVGVFVTIDGLDVSALKPLPATSLARGGYYVDAHEATDVRGFNISSRRLATFRFSPQGQSYAERLHLRPPERELGTIRVTFVTLAPAPPQPPSPASERDEVAVEKARRPTRLATEAPPSVEGTLVDLPPPSYGAESFEQVIDTISLTYEDATTHEPLGTAPPPAVVVEPTLVPPETEEQSIDEPESPKSIRKPVESGKPRSKPDHGNSKPEK